MSFRDAVRTLEQPSAWRYVDMVYWGVLHKTKLVFDSFTYVHAISTEDLRADFHHEIEEQFQMTFDFSDYNAPSHYSEIFTDWKEYEDVISHVLELT